LLALLHIYLFVRYNQAIIFYQTGKLAYHSSKIWEQYDVRFRITEVRTTLAMLTPFPSRSCVPFFFFFRVCLVNVPNRSGRMS
jgi:hypothetical protein